MSNTSTVTPYATSQSATPGVLAHAAALASWLCSTSPEERACRERMREARRNQPLAIGPCERLEVVDERLAPDVSAHVLNMTTHHDLLETAASLGYRIEMPAEPLDRNSPVRLVDSSSGERLALSYSDEGRLTLLNARGSTAAHRLVRQHTAHKTVEHLRKLGMSPEVRQLANGEIELRAAERAGGASGRAIVSACIASNGAIEVDIDCVKGNRCEQITAGVAKAIGGRVASMNKKRSWFELPGEPARVKAGE